MSSVTDPIILPEDVLLVPVDELPEETRRQFAYENGDFAITRLRSRTPSKIIDAQAAALISEFRQAKTLAQAIRDFSQANQRDPNEVLESAFPLIQQLVNTQMLLPADSPQAGRIEASLENNASLGELRILFCVQVLQDTEIYQALDAEGKVVAVKLARPQAGPLTTYMLAREASILHRLAGELTPALLAVDDYEGQNYLVLEWVEGISTYQASEELRRGPGVTRLAELLGLCSAILQAYAQLHAQGVVHGDIHPNNILIDAAGQVCIIDFGLAKVLDPDFRLAKIQRGGVAFFFDPEYAAAVLAQQPPPAVTPASEQYALAALMVNLLTGGQYCNFSLEQDAMLRQIVSSPPLPLSELGLAGLEGVEQVLFRALSKDPDRRFASLEEFAAQFEAAAQAVQPPALTPVSVQNTRELQGVLDETLAQVGWESPFLKGGLPRHPNASINYGAAGVAYALYRMASLRSSPDLLALADAWAIQAATQVGNPTGFYNPEIELTQEEVGVVSPYHTASGVFAIQALIAQAMGDLGAMTAALHAFSVSVSGPCEELDLALGLASVLTGTTLLLEALPDPVMAASSGLLATGQSAYDRIWERLAGYQPVPISGELPNLGIAHGWGGLLYASLRWHAATWTAPTSSLLERLDQLAGTTETIGRGARWPWRQSLQSQTYMSGWCNGSAGLIYLWAQAYLLLDEPRYLSLAEKATWNTWEDPAPVWNLCCGLVGRSYGLLHFYKLVRDETWLERARELAHRAAVNARSLPMEEYIGFENSLYKGQLGVALLAAELDFPTRTALPFFESEGWES